MRSRKSMVQNLSLCETKTRALSLRELSSEDESLLCEFIKKISSRSPYFSKGTTKEVFFQGNSYIVSLDHDLLCLSDEPKKIQAIDMIERHADAMRYRHLGDLVMDESSVGYALFNQAPEAFFVDLDQTGAHSALFNVLMEGLFLTPAEKARDYQSGSSFQVNIDDKACALSVKSERVFHVRPSKKDKRSLRLEIMREDIGEGRYGSVSKLSTYAFISGQFQQTKHPRVTKMIKPCLLRNGMVETNDHFIERVELECEYARLFGLKPKPPIYNSVAKLAYLTEREVPGVTLYAHLKALKDAGVLLEADLAYKIGIACFQALASLHSKGIIHGDIHAGNIMIDISPDDVSAQYIDPGMASSLDDEADYCANGFGHCPESSPAMKGKPGYVGIQTLAGDVYVLGLLLAKTLGFSYENRHDVLENQYKLSGLHSCVKQIQGLRLDEAKNIHALLAGVLDRDPARRHTAEFAATRLSVFLKGRQMPRLLGESSSPEWKMVK
jgi:hypothetical protein